MIRKIIFSVYFFCTLGVAFAQLGEQEATAVFQQANEAYLGGNHQKAIEGYEQLLTSNWVSPDLYYNLGSSYLKSDKIGLAILHLERALIHAPKDPDVLHNLALARSKLKDEIREIPSFFLLRWWNQMALAASATFWSVLGLLLLILGAGNLILWIKGKTRESRKRGFVLGLPLLLLGFIPILLAFYRTNIEENSPFAILQAQEVSLQAAPDEGSALIFDLHEGTKVEIVDQIGDWYKVRLLNGDQGWLPITTLERI